MVLPFLFVLALGSDGAVFFENVAFSILVLSTKNGTPVFLKKVLVFQKTCFRIKVLKTSKISSVSHRKTYRSIKRKAILKIPSTAFYKKLCSFCWLLNETSKAYCFPVLRQNQPNFVLTVASYKYNI